MKSSREPVRATWLENPRHDARAKQDGNDDEGGDLGKRDDEGQNEVLVGRCAVTGDVAAEHLGERRQQHQGDDDGEIFDDQPADGDAAIGRVEAVALFEGAQQDHGAGDGEAEAEDDAGADAPAPGHGEGGAEEGGDDDLADRAGDGDPADGAEVGEGEMQADAEHQQDDAHFGKLAGQFAVGDEAEGIGPDQDAGDEVADQRRQPQAIGDQAEDEGIGERRRDRGNQGRLGVHQSVPAVLPVQPLATGAGQGKRRGVCGRPASISVIAKAVPI